jgi:hypothetical protein
MMVHASSTRLDDFSTLFLRFDATSDAASNILLFATGM